MLISSNRLWIGTGNGVIISVPLSEGKLGNCLQRENQVSMTRKHHNQRPHYGTMRKRHQAKDKDKYMKARIFFKEKQSALSFSVR